MSPPNPSPRRPCKPVPYIGEQRIFGPRLGFQLSGRELAEGNECIEDHDFTGEAGTAELRAQRLLLRGYLEAARQLGVLGERA